MARLIVGAEVHPGECGEDDVTSENLDQMADTMEARPPTDEDRRELVVLLRWMAGFVRTLEATERGDAAAPEPEVD